MGGKSFANTYCNIRLIVAQYKLHIDIMFYALCTNCLQNITNKATERCKKNKKNFINDV